MGGQMRMLAGLVALLVALWAAAAADEVAPQSLRQYRLLQQAGDRYRTLAAAPQLTALPPLPARSLRAGDRYSGANALRRLLAALGDLPDSAASGGGDEFDPSLVAALRHYQRRHGLDPDGILGPATWRALTTPLPDRLAQIERTLERWRTLPPNPWRHAIIINIPQFELYALRGMSADAAHALRMKVVVGQTTRQWRTPTLTADLTGLVFRPYWDVPRSIAEHELLPQIRADPQYLDRHHFEVVDAAGTVLTLNAERLQAVGEGTLRLRQRPGSDNALGTVKFVLPNPLGIFLHDTPARGLFSRTRRAFSHGCVRVADPLALAEFALQGDARWSAERIARAMQAGETQGVQLREPVRVYIVYWTVVAQDDGQLLFLDDLYGLDRPAARSAAAGPSSIDSECSGDNRQ